jgi:hypothetical protein
MAILWLPLFGDITLFSPHARASTKMLTEITTTPELLEIVFMNFLNVLFQIFIGWRLQ